MFGPPLNSRQRPSRGPRLPPKASDSPFPFPRAEKIRNIRNVHQVFEVPAWLLKCRFWGLKCQLSKKKETEDEMEKREK